MKSALAVVFTALIATLMSLGYIASAAQQSHGQRKVLNDSQPIPEELKPPNAPKTARQVTCFRSIKAAFTMTDVVRRCGIPDEHHGSGIFIFLYHMDDGSIVTIGTSDLNRPIMNARHVKSGRSVSLLRKAPKRQRPK